MKKQNYIIAPSLLSANFAKLGDETAAVIRAGADMLHLDVMDNHYVPNLTVGPLACKALREFGITAPIDVHLMTRPVDRLICEFAEAGASHITFHPEASDHIDRSISLIHQHGIKAGLAFNPSTTLHCLEYLIDKVDLILIMLVNPGFAGQTLIPATLAKIIEAKKIISQSGRDIHLAVDGGVKTENIRKIADCGANFFVAGSSIFGQKDYAAVIKGMHNALIHD